MSESDNPLNDVRELLKEFKLERYFYVFTNGCSFIVLMVCAIMLIYQDLNENVQIVIGMFGSSGTILFSTGKILKMWNDALNYLKSSRNN